MTKYIATPARTRAYYLGADYEDSVTADEVIDSGHEGDAETGLVNADGWPIYRRRETVKFGFDALLKEEMKRFPKTIAYLAR